MQSSLHLASGAGGGPGPPSQCQEPRLFKRNSMSPPQGRWKHKFLGLCCSRFSSTENPSPPAGLAGVFSRPCWLCPPWFTAGRCVRWQSGHQCHHLCRASQAGVSWLLVSGSSPSWCQSAGANDLWKPLPTAGTSLGALRVRSALSWMSPLCALGGQELMVAW